MGEDGQIKCPAKSHVFFADGSWQFQSKEIFLSPLFLIVLSFFLLASLRLLFLFFFCFFVFKADVHGQFESSMEQNNGYSRTFVCPFYSFSSFLSLLSSSSQIALSFFLLASLRLLLFLIFFCFFVFNADVRGQFESSMEQNNGY